MYECSSFSHPCERLLLFFLFKNYYSHPSRCEVVSHCGFFFFFFLSTFLATLRRMEFLGQGSDLSYSCHNARSLTNSAGLRSEPVPWCCRDAMDPIAPQQELLHCAFDLHFCNALEYLFICLLSILYFLLTLLLLLFIQVLCPLLSWFLKIEFLIYSEY